MYKGKSANLIFFDSIFITIVNWNNMLRSIIRYFFETFNALFRTFGQSSAKLVIAPCRLKWIKLGHGDQNFPFNTFIVAECQIKVFILQNALELTAVFIVKPLRNYYRVGDLVWFAPRQRQIMDISVILCCKLQIYQVRLVNF